MDEQILAALQRIEKLLMHIANNTQAALPQNGLLTRTYFYPESAPTTTVPVHIGASDDLLISKTT